MNTHSHHRVITFSGGSSLLSPPVCTGLCEKATGKRESIPRAQLGHRQPHKSSTLILPDSPLLANAPNWMLCILCLLHLRHMLSGVWTTDTLFVVLSVILIRLTSLLLLCSCLDAWLDAFIDTQEAIAKRHQECGSIKCG